MICKYGGFGQCRPPHSKPGQFANWRANSEIQFEPADFLSTIKTPKDQGPGPRNHMNS